MKKLLAILAVAGTITACNNSGDAATTGTGTDTTNKATEIPATPQDTIKPATPATGTDTLNNSALDKVKEGTDKVKEGVDKAADNVKEGADKMKEGAKKIEEGADKLKEAAKKP